MDITILWAFLLDLILGDPRRPTHPVILIGHLIGFLEKKFRRFFDKPRDLKRAGVVLWLVTIVTVYFITLLSIRVAYEIGLWFGHTVSIWLMYTTLSVRNLADEAMGIFKEIQKGNMVGARKRLAGIVGRDTMDLNISEISRATIETVAENTVDGIISPLFYAFIGGVPLAMTYKAVNTLDSMVGYKNDKYRHIGWCSARMDDFFNFLPARLGGVLMLFSALLLRLDVQQGIRTVLSDAKKHKSPNSGISEAITAGVLGVRLGGWSQYFGVRQFRAYMGEQTRQIVLEDIKKTVTLSILTSFVTVVFGEIIMILIKL